MRLVALRVPIGILLHFAELWAFAEAYDLNVIGPLLAMKSALALGIAMWWGALEGLRNAVRERARQGDWGGAERVARSYLALSVDVALLALAVAVGSVVLLPSHFGGFDIFNAYALSIGLRFGLEAFASAYHSGIFALRRVYRPPWTIFLPAILEIGLVFGLWPVLGLWGFAFAGLGASALNAGLTAGYARRAYRDHGRMQPRWSSIGKARSDLSWERLRALAKHAFANLTTHVDAAVVLILSLGLGEQSPSRFVLLLHVLRPLLSVVGTSSRAFYFDFKQLSLSQLSFFRRRLARVVSRSAWILALLMAALAAVVDYLWFERRLSLELGLVLLYALARAFLSVEQLRLFTQARYATLASGSVLLLAGVALARWLLPQDVHAVVVAVAGVLALALWFKRDADNLPSVNVEPGVPLLPYRWLHELSLQREAVLVAELSLVRGALISSGAVLNALSVALPEIRFARLSSNTLVAWSLAARYTEAAFRRALAETSAGGLREARVLEVSQGAEGAQACLGLPRVAEWARQPLRVLPPELSARFARDFPDGKLLSLQEDAPRSFFASHADVNTTLHAIYALASGKTRAPTPALARAAVFCPAGEPELVFLVPEAHDRERFRDFSRAVHAASVAASLHQ